MNKLRNLLLDCRAALRHAVPDFEQTPLGDQLDTTIIELGRADDTRKAEAAPDRSVAKRVAYAWQAVTRELRHTHPDMHQALSDKVLERLDVNAVDDADNEIAALQAQLAKLEQSAAAAHAELASLRGTLAEAVPLADVVSGSEADLSLQRLQRLVDVASSGGKLSQAAPPPAATLAPSRGKLQAVVAGSQRLQDNEREWCVGEAMVLTGFQQTPVQLIDAGDAALAKIVLDGMPSRR